MSNCCVPMSRLTEKCLGKYLKKLVGRTDLEDALKRLENLTNEEVRMVTAQVLKATDTVGDRVRVVESNVRDVDNKVAGVDERVAGVDKRVTGVDDRMAGVGERVACVDENVKAIDDKVAVVIDGAQPSLISQQQNIFNPGVLRGKADDGSHATSRRRHGANEMLVAFLLRSHGCAD